MPRQPAYREAPSPNAPPGPGVGAAEDAALIARIKAGDRSAEARLYHKHVQSVNAIAVRLLGRCAEAEDVVQDAFVTALSRLGQLRDGALFRAWLLRITVHEVHRRFRRRKLLQVLGLDRSVDDAGLGQLAVTESSTETHSELAGLDRALAKLPSRERVAWMLRYVEGYELSEVASACDTSLASVKRWIARAELRVRAHFVLEADHA